METVAAGAKKLVSMFPELCSLNLTKKSGYPEIRLRDKRGDTRKKTDSQSAYFSPPIPDTTSNQLMFSTYTVISYVYVGDAGRS